MSADVSEAVEALIGRALKRAPVMPNPNDRKLVYALVDALQEGSGALPASPSGGQGSSAAPIPTEGEEPSGPPAWQTCTPPEGVLLLGYSDLESRAHKAPELYAWTGQTFQSLIGWHDSGVSHWIATSHALDPKKPAAKAEPEEATGNRRRLAAKAAARRMGMEARQSRNAPQPSPEPREREEGRKGDGSVRRSHVRCADVKSRRIDGFCLPNTRRRQSPRPDHRRCAGASEVSGVAKDEGERHLPRL